MTDPWVTPYLLDSTSYHLAGDRLRHFTRSALLRQFGKRIEG